jgi:L-fuconolactonase
MPDNIGIIDTHLHLWDPRRLSYAWHGENPLLARPYLIEDYPADVAAMVFVECFVNEGQFEAEVRFAEEQIARDPRIKAIVAHAKLEEGAAVLPYLQHLKATTPKLRAIRRNIEAQSDPDFCIRPAFIEGVKLLQALELPFEMTVNFRHMERLLRFVDQVPDVALMLDHCGKPGIRDGLLEPWRTQLRTLAAHPNVLCKISGLTVEADPRSWTEDQLLPFIEAAVEAFGFERLVYGSDWPVCLQATSLTRWVSFLDRCFAGVPADQVSRFYRDNATDFYRLG